MKKQFSLMTAILGGALLTVQAQFGGGPAGGGPSFSGATAKLFGAHQAFSATLEFVSTNPAAGNAVTMPGKLSFDAGKSRFEMNMAEMKGGGLPPEAAEHMKAMGMDSMVSITLPDKKVTCIVYPGLQGYFETPLREKSGAAEYKLEVTELGHEKVDGHDCVKNQIVVTDTDGAKHESTVWNATDLEKFPVKIESTKGGSVDIMRFKDISLKKPKAEAFEVPSDCKKYPGMQAMMQEVMMKKMGGMMPPR